MAASERFMRKYYGASGFVDRAKLGREGLMAKPEEILKALAECGTICREGFCILCLEDIGMTSPLTKHKPECPYRLAVEWEEENEKSSSC